MTLEWPSPARITVLGMSTIDQPLTDVLVSFEFRILIFTSKLPGPYSAQNLLIRSLDVVTAVLFDIFQQRFAPLRKRQIPPVRRLLVPRGSLPTVPWTGGQDTDTDQATLFRAPKEQPSDA